MRGVGHVMHVPALDHAVPLLVHEEQVAFEHEELDGARRALGQSFPDAVFITIMSESVSGTVATAESTSTLPMAKTSTGSSPRSQRAMSKS